MRWLLAALLVLCAARSSRADAPGTLCQLLSRENARPAPHPHLMLPHPTPSIPTSIPSPHPYQPLQKRECSIRCACHQLKLPLLRPQSIYPILNPASASVAAATLFRRHPRPRLRSRARRCHPRHHRPCRRHTFLTSSPDQILARPPGRPAARGHPTAQQPDHQTTRSPVNDR